jgi:hypothetical protein
MSAAVAPLPQSKEARQSAALGRNTTVPTNADVAAILLKLSAIESGMSAA